MTKAIILGSGGSEGIPVLGCSCITCLSENTKDKRHRPSLLLQLDNKNILFDVSPDVRENCLENHIQSIDAVFLSHYHEDHIGGLNDLRPFFHKQGPIPLIASALTVKVLKERFSYLLNRFDIKILHEDFGNGHILDVPYKYCTYHQCDIPVTGFRIGDLAYITDIKEYKDNVLHMLQGLSTLIVSAIHEQGSCMHFSLQEAMNFARLTKTKRAYITHITHEILHDAGARLLQNPVELAFDGLEFAVRI